MLEKSNNESKLIILCSHEIEMRGMQDMYSKEIATEMLDVGISKRKKCKLPRTKKGGGT